MRYTGFQIDMANFQSRYNFYCHSTDKNMSYVMAVNLLCIKNFIYYIPALNSGLVHIWATFITVQWRSDVWIYLQHHCMSVESICVPGDVMYANFNWILSMSVAWRICTLYKKSKVCSWKQRDTWNDLYLLCSMHCSTNPGTWAVAHDYLLLLSYLPKMT